MLPRSIGSTLYAYAHTHYTYIQIGLLLTRVLVDLCRYRPQIVTAQKLDLEINLAAARFQRNTVFTLYFQNWFWMLGETVAPISPALLFSSMEITRYAEHGSTEVNHKPTYIGGNHST